MPGLTFPAFSEVLDLLPPAGAALVVFLAGAWLARRGSPAWAGAAAVAAVLVAFAWTFTRTRGVPAFPPGASTERGFFSVLGASALALVPALARTGPRARLLPCLLAAPLALVWVAGGLSSGAMPAGRLGLVAVGAIAWLILLDRASMSPGPLFALGASAALCACAQVFLMYRSAVLAELAAAVGIAMGLIGLASFFLRGALPASLTLPLGVIILALSLDSELFSYNPPSRVALVLLAAALLAPLVFFGGVADRRPVLKRSLLAAALSLAVTATGFYLAWRSAPPQFG